MQKILERIVNLLVHSPLYPHWLVTKKMNEANDIICAKIHGKVLEVGAGDGARKKEFLNKYNQITKYVTTDYSTWDDQFSEVNKTIGRFGLISEIIYGFKKREKMDVVCSATELPFANNLFDYHISFEVLEHIDNPLKYFSEASRVLKKGGKIILSVPVFFRIHGGEPNHLLDYYRYMPGFFYSICKSNRLNVEKIYSNTGLGTTIAQMINQYLILKIKESNNLIKYLLLPFTIIVFPISNIIGNLIDSYPDFRFSTRFHIVFEKR